MSNMRRTTIYLPDEMKTAVEREAARLGVTEAEVIRGALTEHLRQPKQRSLNLPLFSEGLGFDLAGRVDEYMEGFGEDR